MAGGLLWLASRTRPDIAFPTSRVSSLAAQRPNEALAIGKKILRYLQGTKHFALVYRPAASVIERSTAHSQCDAHLECFADAAHEDVLTQTGVGIYVHACLVD